MRGFKKIWLLPLLLVGVLMLVPWAFAESPRVGSLPTAMSSDVFETTVAITSTASLGSFGPGSIIYGFTCIATAANASCGLYDVATLPAAIRTQGVFIDELNEATADDTVQSLWPAPYKLVTDLTVVLTSATVVVYHSPQ